MRISGTEKKNVELSLQILQNLVIHHKYAEIVEFQQAHYLPMKATDETSLMW